MKLKLLLLLLFSACFSFANAQTWDGEGARWWYDYQNSAYIGFTEIFANGDTIIEGKNVKIFPKRTVYYHRAKVEFGERQLQPAYMYEQNNVIYLWQNNGFDTLFNFDANVGDTWETAHPFVESVSTEVLSKGSTELNGVTLRWFEVMYKSVRNSQFPIKDTILERIGNLNLYMFAGDYFGGLSDGNEGGPLRCYEDQNIGSYHNPDYDLPCNFVTSTNEVNNKYHIQVSPNPFTGFVKITLDDNLPKGSEILVQTVTGHTLKRFKIPPNAGHLDIPLAELPQGFYLLNIIKIGKILYTTKIVKI